jgi:hypothetical protein
MLRSMKVSETSSDCFVQVARGKFIYHAPTLPTLEAALWVPFVLKNMVFTQL